jgi:uncharacterized protein
MILQRKLDLIKSIICKYKSCVVAFSGGQDSALLLKVCAMVLAPDKFLAVTAVSETYPKSELTKAKNLAQSIGLELKVIRTYELKNKKFAANSIKRCYFCKKELFSRLIKIAKQNKLDFVFEASNITDKKDYRPGNIAKKELKIKSPLVEAGFTKDDICKLSKSLGLFSWNKPSLACLASRVAYGIKITPKLLKTIDQAEEYLHSLGFKQVRLRYHNGLCRIEVEKRALNKFLNKRQEIVGRLKKLGCNYITLDLEGYRTGSMNAVINQ